MSGSKKISWLKFILTAFFCFSLVGLGCGVRFPREEAEPNPDPVQPITYQAINPANLMLQKIGDLFLPTRIKISPDGKLMFIAELGGTVVLFKKNDLGEWVRQGNLFFDLGDLQAEGERGLTGLFLGANFDSQSDQPENRDVFLNYQIMVDGVFRNRITRVTATLQGGDHIGTDSTVIYEGPEPSAPAHQIQDGVGFIYEGSPHILVEISDGFAPEDALDPNVEGHGKLLLMQRDGSDPLGPRPFPVKPKVQAIGLRNTYGIFMAPESADPRRRVLGVENGNNSNDRIWFLEVVDFGHEVDGQISLGYTGDDLDAGWTQVPDVNTPGGQPNESVLALINPVVSPTSVCFHSGGGFIPPPDGNSFAFVVAYLGGIGTTDNKNKNIALGIIENLGGQPSLTLELIIQRSPEAEGTAGNPVGLEVDPATGDIFFTDLLTGELDQAILL